MWFVRCCSWGFVTHGCVDGYSRAITFLKTTTDNTSKTVLSLFVQACTKLGLPSRVRCDRGGENIDVALFMNLMRGTGRASVIAGKSVHNQRIERMWRDVAANVTAYFYSLFYQLEDEGICDINNDVHTAALHLVFLPEINNQMDNFRRAWNNHRVRTAGSRSPEELWMAGMLNNVNSTHVATMEVFGDQPPISVRLEHALQHFQLDIEPLLPGEGLQVERPITIDNATVARLQSAVGQITDLKMAYKTALQILTAPTSAETVI